MSRHTVTPCIGGEVAGQWGKPESIDRHQKMVNFLDAFSKNACSKNDRGLETAIQHWDRDLQF